MFKYENKYSGRNCIIVSLHVLLLAILHRENSLGQTSANYQTFVSKSEWHIHHKIQRSGTKNAADNENKDMCKEAT
jgi:hypothetical protein